MVEGKTASGFSFKVDERALSSVEFYDVLADLKDAEDSETQNPNDPSAGLRAMQAKRNYEVLILGKEQRNALMQHCRGENGFTDKDVFQRELQDILSAAAAKNAEIKNS